VADVRSSIHFSDSDMSAVDLRAIRRAAEGPFDVCIAPQTVLRMVAVCEAAQSWLIPEAGGDFSYRNTSVGVQRLLIAVRALSDNQASGPTGATHLGDST
jgi:hypothetical protein